MSESHSDYQCPFNGLKQCTSQCMAATAISSSYDGSAQMRCYLVDAVFSFERLVNGFVGASQRDGKGYFGHETGLVDDVSELVNEAKDAIERMGYVYPD